MKVMQQGDGTLVGAADGPAGLGGWLILVGAYLAYTSSMCLFRAGLASMFYMDNEVRSLHEMHVAGNQVYIPTSIALNSIFCLFGVVCLVLFFREKKYFPKLIQIFVWLHAAYVLAVTVALFMLTIGAPASAKLIVDVVRPLIIAGVVTAYMRSSRRVAATFVR